MGLFTNFSGNRDRKIDIREGDAVVCMAFILYAGVGNFQGAEVSVFLETVRKYSDTPFDYDIEYNFDNFRSLIDAHGKDAVLDRCIELLKPSHYEAVFLYLVDGVLADGVLTKEEEKTIELIKGKLNIDDQLATKIIDVMLIKHN